MKEEFDLAKDTLPKAVLPNTVSCAVHWKANIALYFSHAQQIWWKQDTHLSLSISGKCFVSGCDK